MSEVILANYESLNTAHQVIDRMVNAGIARNNIGLAVYNPDNKAANNLNTEDVTASEGAEFGAIVGTLTGLVAGLVAITVPGVGPIIAAGPLAAIGGALMGSGIGAASGAATGGLTAWLLDLGMSEDESNYYAESVRRGDALVTATVDEANASYVMDIMREFNPVDMDRRVSQWRAKGWNKFDPMVDPYTAVDLEQERSKYSNNDYPPHNEETSSLRRYNTPTQR
jgi:uncharacterized membrane protein